jgi:uncharacterized protein
MAVCVVAHGAGGDMRSRFLDGVAEGLVAGGVTAMRFNFPYAEAGRRTPDRPPLALDAWRAALAEAASRAQGTPLVASGKSFGGRMASLLAAEMGKAFPAAALVFLGYPLHAPGKPEQPRTAHLPSVAVPMLFIQGTRDTLARFDLVTDVVNGLGASAELHSVEGGDHSFRAKGARRPDDAIGRELGGVAAEFIKKVMA